MDQSSKSFLIVADGEFLSVDQILLLSKRKVIVALDRACERLLDVDILPDIVVGDFDSIRDKQRFEVDKFTDDDAHREIQINGKTIQMVYRSNPNETDFFKAIRYIDELGPCNIHVACALSKKRLDHLINNLRALRVFYQKNRPIYFYTSTQVARYMKNETLRVSGQIGGICGVLGFPIGSFSSKGLKYDGDNFPLTFGFSDSVANEFLAKTATITITGEALFIQDMKKKIASKGDFPET